MPLYDQIWAHQQRTVSQKHVWFIQPMLFDWIACGMAGASEPCVEAARALVLPGDVPLFGGGVAEPRSAALINATASHALDYDDTNFAHIGHVSTVVFPACLAFAMQEAARVGQGPEALEKLLYDLVIGIEAAARFGQWLGRDHYQAGWHQTATAGAFGAVLGLAKMARLDEATTLNALGLCASRAAGLKAQFGTMGKPLNAGFAASAAIECVALARAGATSTRQALDGPHGFGPTHAGVGDAKAWRIQGMNDWRMQDTRYKFHACCHGLHAMLEALGSLMPLSGAVKRVTIWTHPRWLTVCNQPSPETGLAAKFSFRLTAAMALSGVSTAALDSYSDATCARPDLIALRNQVVVEPRAGLSETAACVQVETTEGSSEAEHDLAGPENQVINSPLEQTRKWAALREKAVALIGPDPAAELETLIFSGKGAGVKGLGALMSRPMG